jgi:AraC-like DNA-binding protein
MGVAADKRFAQELRKLLQSSFAEHRCLNAQQCANLLGISVRSMQRRLQALGLQFSTLVEEVRFDLAREKLLNSGDTIGEIAEALGYSTQEGCIRAFNRWSSISPGKFRRQGHV